MSRNPPAVDLTMLVCTFNRCDDLREMLETALAQETDGAFTYDVLVVDNNSTDGTRAVVEHLIAAGHANLRYLFEEKQGKSRALNSGLAAVRGWIYTIADDDFILPPNWLKDILTAFRTHTGVSFVGGKVLPLWQGQVPTWLTGKHWSALALSDYGNETFYADAGRQVCLLACSFRVADVEAVGGYRVGLSVSENSIGGVEDLELLQRLWTSGRRGLYVPGIAFGHKVQANRMTKAYHRRWHTGHGQFYAKLRDPDLEASNARLFDVPAHLYKEAAAAAVGWMKSLLSGAPDRAFEYETQMRFFAGFFQQRRRERRRGLLSELAAFGRDIVSNRFRGRVS